MKELIDQGAILSECRKYRYSLWRIWDPSKDKILFIALNPSTADENKDDATIRRITDFSDQWGFGGFYVCNLFAFRATKPVDMFQSVSPVSDPMDILANDREMIHTAALCTKIVFCWGNEGAADQRCFVVQKMFPEAWCFGTTHSGQPKHPLYLAKDTRLQLFDNNKPYINPIPKNKENES